MFQLQVLSPLGTIFDDSVEEVILPTDQGEIAILPQHVPLFAKLTEGTMTIKKSGKNTVIALIGGFLEVKKGSVTILSDHAIKAENIEVAKALEAKKKAEELMKNKENEEDFALATKELARSIMELNAAEKMKRKLH